MMRLLPATEMMAILALRTLRIPPIAAVKEYLKAVWFA